MASGKIPQWMRTSSHRNLEEESLSTHRAKMIALVCVFLLFVSLSIATVFVWEDGFHLPYLASCVAAFSILVARKNQLTTRAKLVCLSVILGLNCLMTYMAVKEGAGTYGIALASTIWFTGLFGLLMLVRMEKRLSKAAKLGITTMVTALFAMSLCFDSVPSEGVTAFARTWMLASVAPLTFFVVLTPLLLIAYHSRDVTMPHHKWV
jgi:hypothetical protein